MIVATLKETGMVLSEEILEEIIDNARLLTSQNQLLFLLLVVIRSTFFDFDLCAFVLRLLLMRMLTWMEESTKMSGETLLFDDHNS